MICAACNLNQAVKDEYWGYLPCSQCQNRQSNLKKPGGQIEFAGDEIKDGRIAHANDIEPDHRKGVLNKKWLDLYGKKAAKNRGYTDKEIKGAKYVYAGANTYYKEGN